MKMPSTGEALEQQKLFNNARCQLVQTICANNYLASRILEDVCCALDIYTRLEWGWVGRFWVQKKKNTMTKILALTYVHCIAYTKFYV